MSVGGAALRWTGLALLVLAPTAQAVAPQRQRHIHLAA